MSGQFDGGKQAPRVGLSRAGDIEGRAVIDGRANDRQAERHVNRVAEARVLEDG